MTSRQSFSKNRFDIEKITFEMSFIPDTGHYVTERTARVIAAALKENNKIPTPRGFLECLFLLYITWS